MGRAVDADADGVTDAADRLAELDGVTFFESAEDDSDAADDPDAVAVAPTTSVPNPNPEPEPGPPFDGEPVDTGSRGPATVSEPVAAVAPSAVEPVAVSEPVEVVSTPAIPEAIFTEPPSAPEALDDDPDAQPDTLLIDRDDLVARSRLREPRGEVSVADVRPQPAPVHDPAPTVRTDWTIGVIVGSHR